MHLLGQLDRQTLAACGYAEFRVAIQASRGFESGRSPRGGWVVRGMKDRRSDPMIKSGGQAVGPERHEITLRPR